MICATIPCILGCLLRFLRCWRLGMPWPSLQGGCGCSAGSEGWGSDWSLVRLTLVWVRQKYSHTYAGCYYSMFLRWSRREEQRYGVYRKVVYRYALVFLGLLLRIRCNHYLLFATHKNIHEICHVQWLMVFCGIVGAVHGLRGLPANLCTSVKAQTCCPCPS